MEKILDNVRFTLKNDTEENWKKAVNFIPKKGEPIIYNKDNTHDYIRIKVGDGATLVNSLPFYGPDKINYTTDDGEWIEKFGKDIPVLTANNTFTGTNVFKGLTRFQEIKPDRITDVGEILGDGDTRIKYLAEPTEASDAATKGYVDEKSKTAETAKTAEKLATSRKIGISGNGISTAVSFDGSANVNIPLTGFYNTGLKWSNSGDTAGSISPMGAAIIPNFNANRIAFLPDNAIEVEYSNDGGNTWTNCKNHETNIDLTTLFNKSATSYSIGNKRATNAKASTDDKLRITFTSREDNHVFIYCNIRKIFIYVTTEGATGSKVLIEKATFGAPDTFTTVKESRLEGWSGWNEINTTLFFGGGAN